MTAPGSPTRENPESEEPAVSASTVGLFAGLLLARAGVRVTVTVPEENDAFLEASKEVGR